MAEQEMVLTPMMKQYREAKADIPGDAILLFRLGDFYEMFFEDAARASALLDIVLTRRAGVPMCGFPYHALEMHLPKLLGAGVKVAIAEQLEDPKLAKGIVKRAVTRIITPGTIIDGTALSPSRNNFLLAICTRKEQYGLALLDISTGEFKVTELTALSDLETELNRLGAVECIVPQSLYQAWEVGDLPKPVSNKQLLFTPLENYYFAYDWADDELKRHFGVATLDGFGCRGVTLGVCAAGAVLHYAVENLRQSASHVTKLIVYSTTKFLKLDPISQRNLELVEPMYGTDRSNTLLAVLDKTGTPMGGRLLRSWVLRPLYDRDAIVARLDAVEGLKEDPLTLAELRETLGVVRDLERIVGRLNVGTANARDMLTLASGLSMLPGTKRLLQFFDVPKLAELEQMIELQPELVDRIERAIVEEPPAVLNEGGIFKEQYNEELDELRKAAVEGKNWLSDIQQREQERTRIKSLKVKYNSVFGYYIEVSKSNLDLVPDDYIRKQTLVNAERFITPELKELESKILGAEDKARALEAQLFQELRDYAQAFTVPIQNAAAALGEIDALASLAEVARERNYIRPKITEDETLQIIGGRHPVLEVNMRQERFVPNDVKMDGDRHRMMIITGPNMAGKSTYIRQTALLVLMAQMGSFLPADFAKIGLVDRIFTRVGASDDLSRGQSTFMVEMVETANILNHATPKSLVILDEIGRGTSTFDGLSIAWAVAEFLHDNEHCHCRTQFATHYHELTELAKTKNGVDNYNVLVREYGDQIVFLRQIVPGATDKSYGIHVAKLAGLPDEVVDRANAILEVLEESAPSFRVRKNRRKSDSDAPEEDSLFQLPLF